MKNNLLNVLFQSQSKEVLDLVSMGEIQQIAFGKKEIVHLEGERCDYFEIILSGTISVERIDEQGNLLTIAILKKGDVLGANLVFSSMPIFPMTITTAEKSIIYRLTRAAIKRLCMADEAVLDAVLSNLSNRSLYLGDTIKRLSKRSIREQIMDYLSQQVTLQGRNTIVLTDSKTGLARRFGIERTSLSRELQKMRDDGLIEFTTKTITLL